MNRDEASTAGNGEMDSGAGKLLLSSIVYYYIALTLCTFFMPGLRFEVGVLEIKRRKVAIRPLPFPLHGKSTLAELPHFSEGTAVWY